ncbi:MAG: hypothetical protein JO049_06895, partial [Hyphomicrobiales bacterium]|nr:hypothetical protein [Hyphomicrobiales bacterium]
MAVMGDPQSLILSPTLELRMRPLLFLATKILSTTVAFAAFAQAPAAPPHNIVLFVADGLRFRMVDDRTAPTMAAIAR